MPNTDIEKSNQRTIGIDESKYLCCCGLWDVISCTKFFSILSIVLSAITLLSSYFYASWFKSETFNIVFISSMVSAVIDIILNAGVLYGIYRIKPVALLPYTIVKAFFLIILGFSIFIGFMASDFLIAIILVSALETCLLWYPLVQFGISFVFSEIAPAVDLGVFMMLYFIIVGASVLGLFFIGCLFVHMFYRAYKYLKEVELRRYATVDQMQNVPTYQ